MKWKKETSRCCVLNDDWNSNKSQSSNRRMVRTNNPPTPIAYLWKLSTSYLRTLRDLSMVFGFNQNGLPYTNPHLPDQESTTANRVGKSQRWASEIVWKYVGNHEDGECSERRKKTAYLGRQWESLFMSIATRSVVVEKIDDLPKKRREKKSCDGPLRKMRKPAHKILGGQRSTDSISFSRQYTDKVLAAKSRHPL